LLLLFAALVMSLNAAPAEAANCDHCDYLRFNSSTWKQVVTVTNGAGSYAGSFSSWSSKTFRSTQITLTVSFNKTVKGCVLVQYKPKGSSTYVTLGFATCSTSGTKSLKVDTYRRNIATTPKGEYRVKITVTDVAGSNKVTATLSNLKWHNWTDKIPVTV
jgi:hypothetical protein